MEDPADAVVPLRPGFDIQMRGFNRSQVTEHIETLENQLELVTVDRNEAAQLNNDLRRLCDDTRHSLDRAEERLKRIESSDTGLPAASQRVQNMLDTAEEEVQELRDRALHQAEIVRGSAETEANTLITQAENTASGLRAECAELMQELERRRVKMRQEHARNVRELREREARLRQKVRDEYKRLMDQAQAQSDAMLAGSREQCAQWDAESERLRLDALEEISGQRDELENRRGKVIEALEGARQVIGSSSHALHAQIEPSSEVSEAQAGSAATNGDGIVRSEGYTDISHLKDLDSAEHPEVDLPGQREDCQTFTVPVGRSHTTTPDGDLAESTDTSSRN